MNDAFCPTCRKKLPGHNAEDMPYYPFCSERCRLIDLGRWLNDDYIIPGPESSMPDKSDKMDDGRRLNDA